MNELVEKVSRHLEESDFSSALNVIRDPKHESHLKKPSWDLIQVIVQNMTKDKVKDDTDVKVCCEEMLRIIAEVADPEEIVPELSHQMSGVNSTQFEIILKLLGASLRTCPRFNEALVGCSLVSIRSYLEDILISDSDYASEEEYEEELYCQIPEIVAVLKSVFEFYSHFVDRISKEGSRKSDLKTLLLSRLIQLYDFFLSTGPETKLQPLNEIECNIMKLISRLTRDPFHLLQFIFSCSLEQGSKKRKKDSDRYYLKALIDEFEAANENVSVFECNYVISKLAYAVFFYCITCENGKRNFRIPVVYSPKYVFLSLSFLIASFFEKSFDKIIMKGLTFLDALLDMLDHKLERWELYFQSHEKLLVHLNNLMVYSQNETIRKCALKCFKKYVEAFDFEGRYLLLSNFRCKIVHSGTLSFLITSIKEYVVQYLDDRICEEHSKYFKGKLLHDIIMQYCSLTDGDKTDLVENADQIISALNLLRFLLLRDKENKTGIKSFIKNIDEAFLIPLKRAISSTKEFYELKKEECALMDNKVELTVNKQTFPQLSREQQKNAVFACLNAVDLINSLLLRVLECVHGDV